VAYPCAKEEKVTSRHPGSGLEEMTASALARVLGTEDEPFLLDVRQPEEVAAWAIPGVRNIPLGELRGRLLEVPADRPVVVICQSGNRSGQANQVLTRAGYQSVNLTGGMGAWGQVYDTSVSDLAGAQVVQVRRRGKGCLSYLVGSGDEAFVIDPSTRVETYTTLAEARSWRITRVFDTHLHADHLSGARELAQRSGASLHLSSFDTFEFPYQSLRDGETFSLPGGAEISVAALHTPGHTEGSVTLVLDEQAVFSGDTLFIDGVGRPDLAERAEEFARILHRSLNEKLLLLPHTALVFPAHYGNRTTVVPNEPVVAALGVLRSTLHALSLDEDGFVAWATANVAERPPNYVEVIHANMGRTTLSARDLAQLETGPNRCSI
jgi:glyoxylase-like metal-dependent hydrolase (beta-lactamase superfamily II)/rhodanese-related sulfurtransferase